MSPKSYTDHRIIVVSAPSGAGKTTICRWVVDTFDDYRLSISHTTRKPRGDERDGREYHFVASDEAFKDMIARNAFVEYAHVYNRYYYGTSWDSITAILDDDHNAVLDIDVQGAEQIKARFPHAELILVVPPSMTELARRLRERKTDDPEEIKRRLDRAREELTHGDKFDYILQNDDLEISKLAMRNIIEQRPEANDMHISVMQPVLESLMNESIDG